MQILTHHLPAVQQGRVVSCPLDSVDSPVVGQDVVKAKEVDAGVLVFVLGASLVVLLGLLVVRRSSRPFVRLRSGRVLPSRGAVLHSRFRPT